MKTQTSDQDESAGELPQGRPALQTLAKRATSNEVRANHSQTVVAPAGPLLLAAPVLMLQEIPCIPIPGQSPGFLFESTPSNPPATSQQPAGHTDFFHETEPDAVYDLYNACNGVLREDGMLEVSKLNELSKEEEAFLNVPRLRELWVHIFGGCTRCETIIQRLNMMRAELKKTRNLS